MCTPTRCSTCVYLEYQTCSAFKTHTSAHTDGARRGLNAMGCGTKHQSISRCAPTCAPDSSFPMRKTHMVSLRKHNACSTARDTSLYECCSDGNVNPASYRGRQAVGIRRLTVDCSTTHAVFSPMSTWTRTPVMPKAKVRLRCNIYA